MKKQRKFPRAEIAVGLKVVVSEAPDTKVYTVKEVAGLGVRLVYTLGDGREVSGGWVDYSLCMVPTGEQLANNA